MFIQTQQTPNPNSLIFGHVSLRFWHTPAERFWSFHSGGLPVPYCPIQSKIDVISTNLTNVPDFALPAFSCLLFFLCLPVFFWCLLLLLSAIFLFCFLVFFFPGPLSRRWLRNSSRPRHIFSCFCVFLFVFSVFLPLCVGLFFQDYYCP